MLYNRGAREIYDAWGADSGSGAPTWSAEACLPYFKAHEDNSRGASAWHGAGGVGGWEVYFTKLGVKRMYQLRGFQH